MILALPLFLQLAAAHAPEVAPETLLAFAQHESGLNPNAIHDNTARRTYLPPDAASATALASELLAQGHSLDLGIMQVNSANLRGTGLTVAAAFDPGQSIRAGSMILVAAYRQCLRGRAAPTGPEQQEALRCAASIYNTGNEQAGILNGYQPRVWRVAAQLVPAIQVAGATPVAPLPPSPAAGDVATPAPRRPPPGLEDVLHATPPVPDSPELSDALHVTPPKEAP